MALSKMGQDKNYEASLTETLADVFIQSNVPDWREAMKIGKQVQVQEANYIDESLEQDNISPCLTPFVKIIVQVCRSLTEEDVVNMKLALSVSGYLKKGKMTSLKYAANLIAFMFERELIAENNTVFCMSLLDEIGRKDQSFVLKRLSIVDEACSGSSIDIKQYRQPRIPAIDDGGIKKPCILKRKKTDGEIC